MYDFLFSNVCIEEKVKWMRNGFSEFFELVDFHSPTILKKTTFVFAVINFNERIIFGSHL